MVFEPTDILYVVERIGAVTKKALVYTRMVLPRDHLVHHHEVVHVVARRRLVALRTFLGGGRRMEKLRNSPCIECVTAHAFAPEQSAVRFSIAVTADAVEAGLLRFVGVRYAQEFLHIGDHLSHDCARRRVCFMWKRPNAQKRGVIHPRRPHAARMLEMAAAALLARRVECRRLLPEIRSGR
ncbi:hypothetical protein KXW36_000895, partial [Aspergillus fumigatus]